MFQKQFCSLISRLAIQALELTLIDLAAKALRKKIDGPETAVVPGAFVFLAGIA